MTKQPWIVRVFFPVQMLCGACALPPAEQEAAREGRWDFGYRAGTSLGKGEPANDLPIAGNVFARRWFSEASAWKLWVESAAGDFEEPAKVVGLEQDQSIGAIDADQEVLTFGAAYERLLASSSSGRHELLGLVGLGWSSIDVDDVSGPLEGGGTFDITTDPGDELLATAGLEYRLALSARWALEAEVRYDFHFADWKVRDTVSGSTGEIDDYGTYGVLLGIAFSP